MFPIVLIAIIVWSFGLAPFPDTFVAIPNFAKQYVNLDFSDLTWKVASPVFAIYIICLFDVAGVAFGVCTVAGLIGDDGQLPKAYWIFLACGIGSCIAPFFSVTPVIVL